MTQAALLFPYGAWVHTESYRSAYCLAQSGLPMPQAPWLGLEAEQLLGYPGARAQPEFEARLARLFGLSPERVLATLGATGAMHLCAQHWLRPGQPAALETPAYQALPALLQRHSAPALALARSMQSGWHIEPEALAELARGTRHPLHVWITNPHNPSGAVLDGATVAALAAAVQQGGGVLVCNESYMELAAPQARVHAATLAPNAVSIGSLSKAYGLGALRAGWLLLGEGLLAERPGLLDQAYLTWNDPPTAGLNAALLALDHLDELLKPLRELEARSRPHLVRWLEESQSVAATVPPFGLLAFARVLRVDDTQGLQRMLAREFDLDVVAGEFFGAPGHIRVGCAVPEATMVEALVRLENGIRTWLERAG